MGNWSRHVANMFVVALAACGSARSSSSSYSTAPTAETGSCPQEAVVEMAMGTMSTIALLENGQACTWGYSGNGETSAPKLVEGVADLVEIGAGEEFECGRTKSGSVWCWGRNRDGQLGDGTTTERRSPAEVKGVTQAVSLAVADQHVCVAQADGTVKCWGNNADGRAGAPTSQEQVTVPAAVAGMSDIVHVAAWDGTSCVASRTGTVWCWGNGGKGQLGPDTPAQTSSTPVEIQGVEAARLFVGSSSVCAITADGRPRCWGGNTSDRFGVSGPVIAPTTIPELAAARALTIAGDSIRFVDATGQLVVRGMNLSGQLGFTSEMETVLGTEMPATVRTWMKPAGLDQLRAVWGGNHHTCVQTQTGEVRCFGANDHRQLGTGRDEPKENVPPTPVVGLAVKVPAQPAP